MMHCPAREKCTVPIRYFIFAQQIALVPKSFRHKRRHCFHYTQLFPTFNTVQIAERKSTLDQCTDSLFVRQDRYLKIVGFACAGGEHDELPGFSGIGNAGRRVGAGFEADNVFAGAEMLPVGKGGQLLFIELHRDGKPKFCIIKAGSAYAVSIGPNINKTAGLAEAAMAFERFWAGFVIVL